jgi:cell fate regulator YaaT (PSP1 superfamily)
MATVVGVVFQQGGKVYSFDPAGLDLRWDENVICQTARGRELGRVVEANHDVPDHELTGPLKRIVRRAAADDDEQVLKNRIESKRAMLLFRELARRMELPVKPLSAEMVFDQSRIVFSYGSEERLDTHALQAELAKRLNRRVEVRAVGPREGARLCGGGGLCGPVKCCNRFPSHESPITLKMAKEQDLPMNPGRITGLCGRLRCCLAFEHPVYRSFRDRAPAVGRKVKTPHGNGVVRSYEVLRDACMIEIEGERQTLEVKLDDLAEVRA